MKKLYITIVFSILSISLSGMENNNNQKPDYTVTIEPRIECIKLDDANKRLIAQDLYRLYGIRLNNNVEKVIFFASINHKNSNNETIKINSDEHKALKQIFPPHLPSYIFTQENTEYIITSNPLTKENLTIKFVSNGTYAETFFKSRDEYSKNLFNSNQLKERIS